MATQAIVSQGFATPAEVAAEAGRRQANAEKLTARPYRDRRAEAYRDQLGKEQGNFIKTLGDVVDTLIGQVETNRIASGAERTADFDEMVGKITAIRQAIPQPR